ncbi:hypothetical protein [Euzebya pacifica]|uniref:hypothetical protein n=1 Tax=Euzebya pacifica TaxID=1608957 RepID=UPI0030F87629
MDDDPAPGTLVGVDLGLRTGVAVYAPDARGVVRLRRYSSTHLGSRATLKRAAPRMLQEAAPIAEVVVEGDRAMGEIWAKAARRLGATTTEVSPERWRAVLLWPRDRTPSATAKKAAKDRAVQVIEWSRAAGGPAVPPAPTGPLRSDTADAIMIGLWGVVDRGWVAPADLPFPVPGR